MVSKLLYTLRVLQELVKVGRGGGVGEGGGGEPVCMMAGEGAGAPNGFQWKINLGQKSLVSIKNTCIIKVWAAGNRYKLHVSLCPGARFNYGMGFPSEVWGKVEGSELHTEEGGSSRDGKRRNPALRTQDENVLHQNVLHKNVLHHQKISAEEAEDDVFA